MADMYSARLNTLKATQIILSATTSTSLFVTLLGSVQFSTWIAAVSSTVLLVLNLYRKDYDLGERIRRHHSTASKLLSIREAYLSLLTDISLGMDTKAVLTKRDSLQKQLDAIYETAPRTSPKAYDRARKALQEMDEMTFSDAEIDKFLPPKLRQNG